MLESAEGGWASQRCPGEGEKGDAAAWTEAEVWPLNGDEVKCLWKREKQSHEELKWKTRGKKKQQVCDIHKDSKAEWHQKTDQPQKY